MHTSTHEHPIFTKNYVTMVIHMMKWNCWCTLPLSYHHYTMDHNQNAALHAYMLVMWLDPLMHTMEQEWQHFLWLTAWESACPACVTNTPHTYVHVGVVQYTSTSSLQPILNAEKHKKLVRNVHTIETWEWGPGAGKGGTYYTLYYYTD